MVADQAPNIFQVIGGAAKGGIRVRKGWETTSEELEERLSTGSIVKALAYDTGRVHYELIQGAGPPVGWVSTHFHDKALLARQDEATGEQLEEDEGVAVLRWYGELLASAEKQEQLVQPTRQTWTWAGKKASEPTEDIKAELAQDMGLEDRLEGAVKAGEQASFRGLQLTFGYPAGTSEVPCFARFDIRDEVCRRMGGFRHGQVVSDRNAGGREMVVVGVKLDPQTGEESLWLQPQDLGHPGTVAFGLEEVGRLAPVYKGITNSIRKRVTLDAASFNDFEAVEDSDGEGILLCRHCRLPTGTNLYSDEHGNPLHAECMAQHVQCSLREKEEQVQKREASEKMEGRQKYSIGWNAKHIPCNVGPATKLGLHPLPRGMCCLMLQETGEGHRVNIVPTIDPATAVNLEYLSLALKVRYIEGREPTFSLDPLVSQGDSPEVQKGMQAKNFEPAWLAGTSAGEVLFQSDYHLKELSMGEYEQPVIGMKSCFDRASWEATQEWHAREWYIVRNAEMQISGDNVLIPYLKMGVEAREQMLSADGLEDKPITRPDHPLVKYAQEFSDNFELIAERKSVVHHLRELAKASLLAKFLLESDVELDEAWLDLAGETATGNCMEIPQLWNERCHAQIRVNEGKITNSTGLRCPERHGVYGGVKFGLDRFQLGAVTTRPGLRAVPTVAARAAMPTLSMSDVRSMGMLVASMQGKGAPPPAAAIEAVPGAPAAAAARPSMPGMMMAVPGMAGRAAPAGPAPVRPAASTAALARQLQGMLVTPPGLEGRRARLEVPSLHGVDLNLDKFDVDEPVRVASQAPAGSWANAELAGGAIAKAFWSSLDNERSSAFGPEDRRLLKEVFNPHLSDRRDDGDQFTPPDPSFQYVETLRNLVKREAAVRRGRMTHFFSSDFAADNPGPLFPFSWTPAYAISRGRPQEEKPEGPPQGSMRPRPEYVAHAAMFNHVMSSATPMFDKTTEDGLRFRVYKFGSLEVRTTEEHDGEEVVGAVFSVHVAEACAGRPAEASERIMKVTEYVEAAQRAAESFQRRSYVVLETSGGNMIVTEKRADGNIVWEENPEDLEDRNSLAKFIRSCNCGYGKRTIVSVADIQTYRQEKAKLDGSSQSGQKLYVQGVYNRARGLSDRHDSGFGSKGAWHKGKFAKTTQKESRKETRRAEVLARRAAADRAARAKSGAQGRGHRVIDPIVVGTWDDWTYGLPMTFDEQTNSYSVELQMGSSTSESFQILCESDWDMCLHPDHDNACAQEGNTLRGPDSEGHGKNWTIGVHEADQACEGMVYRITLKVDPNGVAEKVGWEPLGLGEIMS